MRTQSWTGPPRAGGDGEEVIYVDIRHEPISGKTSLKRILLTCGINHGYPWVSKTFTANTASKHAPRNGPHPSASAYFEMHSRFPEDGRSSCRNHTHGLSTEKFPGPAYAGSSKNLKDLSFYGRACPWAVLGEIKTSRT